MPGRAAFFAFALLACGAAPEPRPSPPAPVFVTLDTLPCFGPCASYHAELRVDGTLELVRQADAGTGAEPRATRMLDAAALARVRRAFAEAEFFALDAHGALPAPPPSPPVTSGSTTTYDFQDVLVCGDSPRTRILYRDGGRERVIEADHCNATPFTRLEDELIALFGVEAWLGD